MKLYKATIKALSTTGLLMGLTAASPAVATPPLYTWYWNLNMSRSQCRALAEEAVSNANRNWDFANIRRSDISIWTTTSSVQASVGCLSRGNSNQSLITIISTSSKSRREARLLFEELKLNICGECADIDFLTGD